MMKRFHIQGVCRALSAAAFLMLLSVSSFAQVDRHDVRAGNRKFRKDSFKEAEIDYRKAVVKDSTSFAGQYNLANTLYRQDDFDGAGKAIDAVKDHAAGIVPAPDYSSRLVTKTVGQSADYFYNQGDVALQKKDYAAAVEAFKESLLRRPDDLDAKENYIYAKLMLQNQQNGGGGGQNDQNQDQNNDQNQDNQDQNNDQDQDQNQDQNQGDQGQDQQDQNQQPQESKISPQQAQQMLQAIQAKEKETQDKVNKEKAAMLQSRQKAKNW